MKLLAHAKINLYLDVLERLPNGYHRIASVMQSIALADEIIIEPAERTSVDCPGNPDLAGETNLAFKAARLFQIRKGSEVPEVRIEITKRIPVAAGLAGGSADAAAVLVALNQLTGASLAESELAEIGLEIGADVPFCLTGGTQCAEGIGEDLTPLPTFSAAEFVLAKPPVPLSTAEIYATCDRLELPPLGGMDGMLSSIKKGDVKGVAATLGNRLAVPAFYLRPEIEGYLDVMSSVGALGVSVSGSGPTVFGVFSPGEGERAADEVRAAFPEAFVAFAPPSGLGIEILEGK